MPPTSITKVTNIPPHTTYTINEKDMLYHRNQRTISNNLQVHGRQSPYSRQSRIQKLASYSIDDNDDLNSSYQTWLNENVIEIILHPGDVLVIPPFWIHEVEVLECSISLSIWWDCKELDIMDGTKNINRYNICYN